MDSIPFRSKAQNLANVAGKLRNARVLPLVIGSLARLDSDSHALLDAIHNLSASTLIVRSSSKSEDSATQSNAGAFLSIGNVDATDKEAILSAMRRVGDSMPSNDDEILIQPMLNMELCGVAFSVDKDNGAPYYCISYDASGASDTITSGAKGNILHFYHSHFAPMPKDANMAKIVALLKELMELFNYEALDVEFGFSQGELYLLQVRPLVMQGKQDLKNALNKRALERLSKRIQAFDQPYPHILGKRALFGIMPDWNPAEIIGLKPRRLALSLYKEIVTDNIWAYQRDNYGYRNLRSYPLMHSFLGIPYIDVRLSFNSFIPKTLDETIASKLVDYYLNTLVSLPELHDKVEFEIVFSCYDCNTPHKLQKLLAHGFNPNELKRIEFALLNLTNRIINSAHGLYQQDLHKANFLESRYLAIISAPLSLYDKIYWLLEDCKRFGTLPFAGVARAAFVAMQILNSLVEIGFLSPQEKQDFLASLTTVNKQLSIDAARLPDNKAEFLERYGHLRAGSYNILSPRYDESFETYFTNAAPHVESAQSFVLDSSRLQALDVLLKEHGLEINAESLFTFFKTVIEGRENVKFAFSKLLSKALQLIAELGDSLGIAVSDMAHLDIKNILALYASLYKDSPKEYFLLEIAKNKEEFNLTNALKLPPLLTSSEDIFSFQIPHIVPNFITQKSVFAPTAFSDDLDLKGKIVLVESADPGYDYLFAKNIAGLITCYGGANSHMAIRASELNLPAVIGVGDLQFAKCTRARKIQMDCQSGQILCVE